MAIQYNSNYQETMPFSDTCSAFNLSANTAQSWSVPGTTNQYYQGYFEYSSNSNVFVRLNGTAAAPGAGLTTTLPFNEFKPKKRYLRGGDIVSIVTPDTTAYAGLSLRQISG